MLYGRTPSGIARYTPEQVFVMGFVARVDCSQLEIDVPDCVPVLSSLSITSIGSSRVPGMGKGVGKGVRGGTCVGECGQCNL